MSGKDGDEYIVIDIITVKGNIHKLAQEALRKYLDADAIIKIVTETNTSERRGLLPSLTNMTERKKATGTVIQFVD